MSEKSEKALERLQEMLEEKEVQVGDLEKTVERLKYETSLDCIKWQKHRLLDNDDFYKGLPVPRVEMIFEAVGSGTDDDAFYNHEWTYGIVTKPYTFQWDFKDKLLFIPLSKTTGSGGNNVSRIRSTGKIDTPFRDGVHVKFDSLMFGLPAFISCRALNVIHPIEKIEGESIMEVVKEFKK